jgi:predicted dehydrogenase
LQEISRAEVSLAALNDGKHVHCEKPLAVHLEDAKKMIDLAVEKGLLLRAGHLSWSRTPDRTENGE